MLHRVPHNQSVGHPKPEFHTACAMTPSTTNHHDQNASGAWANWLWMAKPPSFGAALCLGSEVAGARALSRLFSRVESGGAEPEVIAEAWGAETFDLIALDPAGTLASRASSDRLWPVCARLLRPGGCLTLITDNLLWYRWSPGGVRRAFSQIRRARGRDKHDAAYRARAGMSGARRTASNRPQSGM